MDILAALNDHSPRKGQNRCKLQRILDDIPDETPGKDALVAAAGDAAEYPAAHLTMTFSALQAPVSADIINDHRAARCLCYR